MFFNYASIWTQIIFKLGKGITKIKGEKDVKQRSTKKIFNIILLPSPKIPHLIAKELAKLEEIDLTKV